MLNMAYICIGLVFYRLLMVIAITLEVLQLNREIRGYDNCCDKDSCDETVVFNDDAFNVDVDDHTEKCLDKLTTTGDYNDTVNASNSLTFCAVAISVLMVVSISGAKCGLTGGKAEAVALIGGEATGSTTTTNALHENLLGAEDDSAANMEAQTGPVVQEVQPTVEPEAVPHAIAIEHAKSTEEVVQGTVIVGADEEEG